MSKHTGLPRYVYVILLLIIPGAIFCASQAALLTTQSDLIEKAIYPIRTADYLPWDYMEVAQVDPVLATLALEEQQSQLGLPTNPATSLAQVSTASPTTSLTPERRSPTPTVTRTPTSEDTETATASATASLTVTRTPSPTASVTPSATRTATATASNTATRTPTASQTSTAPPTNTLRPTRTNTATATNTATSTFTVIPTNTLRPTSTSTSTATLRINTPTSTNTNVPLPTPTSTPVPAITDTPAPLPTDTPVPQPTNTPIPQPTDTPIPPPTATFTPVPILADLAVSMLVSDSAPREGQTIAYTITLTNTGPNPATNVRVQDVLPTSAVAFSLYTASQGSYFVSSGNWLVGDLASGVSATLTIYVSVRSGTAGTPITNTATLTALDQTDPNAANNSAAVTVTPTAPTTRADLGLQITTTATAPAVNSTYTYRVQISNSGPNIGTGIQVQIMLPTAVNYVSHTGVGTYTSGTGIWQPGNLNPGASTALNIVVRVAPLTEGSAAQINASVIASNQSDLNPGNNNASHTLTIYSPGIRLVKNVTFNRPPVGTQTTFIIRVTNNMTIPATNIEVNDVLPAELLYISDDGGGTYNPITGLWQIGSLAVSNFIELRITVQVLPAAAGRTITNTATIQRLDQVDNTPSNDSDWEDLIVPTADLRITKTVSSNNPVLGAFINYTLTITNNSEIPVNSIEVTDVLPAGVTYLSHTAAESYDSVTGLWAVGTLAANGGSRQLIITVQVTGAAGSVITNTATITSSIPPDDPANNTASATLTVQPANLTITHSASTSTAIVGDNITYSVRVTNNDPLNTVTGVVVDFDLPPNVQYVIHTGVGTYDSSTGVWNVGDLPPSNNRLLQVTVLIQPAASGTTLTTSAAILAPVSATSNTVNVTVPLEQSDLELSKTVSNASPNEGDVISYTVQIRNNGPSRTTGVTVQDTLPAGVTFISDSGSYDEVTGIWTIGNLNSGSTSTLTITVIVNSGTAGQPPIQNTASVLNSNIPDPNGGNNSTSAAFQVPGADLGVGMSVDVANPTENQTIRFTVTVTNLGPNNTSNVQVTDILPVGLGFVGASSAEGTYDSGSGVWTVPALNSGQTATLLLDATVLTGTSGATLENAADITFFTLPDSNTGNNRASVIISVQ